MTRLLWSLLALFVLRVAGQALVAIFDVQWLSPMERWYSGLMPYPYLLASQILIIVLMAKVCADFTRGQGFFVEPRRFFAVYWLWSGWVYLAVMLIRLPVQILWFPEKARIPIFFHWVLASFVIATGLWHRRRLRA